MQEAPMINGHHYVSKSPEMAMAGYNVVDDDGFDNRRNNSVPDFRRVSFFSPRGGD